MATLRDLIANMEGWNKQGSIAQRNNNPGNLRAGKGQIGTDSNGFAVFSSPENGWAALDRQIALDAGRGHTLSSFINKYAPSNENDTGNYLSYLSKGLSVDPETPLLNILGPGGGVDPTKPPASLKAGGTKRSKNRHG